MIIKTLLACFYFLFPTSGALGFKVEMELPKMLRYFSSVLIANLYDILSSWIPFLWWSKILSTKKCPRSLSCFCCHESIIFWLWSESNKLMDMVVFIWVKKFIVINFEDCDVDNMVQYNSIFLYHIIIYSISVFFYHISRNRRSWQAVLSDHYHI